MKSCCARFLNKCNFTFFYLTILKSYSFCNQKGNFHYRKMFQKCNKKGFKYTWQPVFRMILDQSIDGLPNRQLFPSLQKIELEKLDLERRAQNFRTLDFFDRRSNYGLYCHLFQYCQKSKGLFLKGKVFKLCAFLYKQTEIEYTDLHEKSMNFCLTFLKLPIYY